MTMCQCGRCGFEYPLGFSGNHDCVDVLTDKVNTKQGEINCLLENKIGPLESEVNRLKQKVNSLITAAKISMVPQAMWMELEQIESETE